MKRIQTLFLFAFLISVLGGCAATKDVPKYDQVLVYDEPFDYTFLKTMEALNTIKGWTLEETDKTKGVIILRNTEYGHIFDHDKWIVRFNLVSLGRKKTSISIDPASQHNVKGGELLDRIDEIMKLSTASKGKNPTLVS